MEHLEKRHNKLHQKLGIILVESDVVTKQNVFFITVQHQQPERFLLAVRLLTPDEIGLDI